MYWMAVVFPSRIPVMGNKINGNNEVTASATASVNHQVAIQIAIAAILVTIGLPGDKSNENKTIAANMGPEAILIRLDKFMIQSTT